MDLQKGLPVTHVTHDEIIKAMCTCVLCGTPLKFHHVTDFNAKKVQEAAQCPACGIKSKVNTFNLQ